MRHIKRQDIILTADIPSPALWQRGTQHLFFLGICLNPLWGTHFHFQGNPSSAGYHGSSSLGSKHKLLTRVDAVLCIDFGKKTILAHEGKSMTGFGCFFYAAEHLLFAVAQQYIPQTSPVFTVQVAHLKNSTLFSFYHIPQIHIFCTASDDMIEGKQLT